MKKLLTLAAAAACASSYAVSYWYEQADAPDAIPGQDTVGMGGSLTDIHGALTSGDADIYRIRIADVGSFSANTFVDTAFDTQLFLFDTTGHGVTFDDDDPGGTNGTLSAITGQFVTGTGTYYLAISGYDKDPTDGFSEIWADTPFNVERAPDGPGAANPLQAWSTTGASGTYVITLSGVDYATFGNTPPPPPPPNDHVEQGDAPDVLPGQATTGTGTMAGIRGTLTAADVDLYCIMITDPSTFRASTGSGGATFDTQLFLFDSTGRGVTMDDDDPGGGVQSTITGAFVTSPGTYYIAISQYNIDPVDANSALIWANTPFGVERAPDGPGAANPLSSWSGTAGSGGNYRIAITGATWCSGGGGPETIVPTGFTIGPGIVLSGTVNEIQQSDDLYLVLRPGIVFSTTQDPIALTVDGHASSNAASSLTVTVESKANQANIGEKIDAFNYTTNAFVQVNSRTLTTSDNAVTVNLTPASQYIDPNGNVRLKLRYKTVGPVFSYPWQVRIDQVKWTRTP